MFYLKSCWITYIYLAIILNKLKLSESVFESILFTSWLKRPKAILISSDHVSPPHMTLAAPFAKTIFFLFGENSFGELHLVKLQLANFIWQNFIWRNFIWRRLATPIYSLALPGSTLATPVALIFSNGWTNKHTHTNIHMLNYIID